MNEYGKLDEHDPVELEPEFGKHMMAMTAEDLHSKGDIAVELAYRDRRIAQLEAELSEAKSKLSGAEHACVDLSESFNRIEAERDALKDENERLHILLDVHRDSAENNYAAEASLFNAGMERAAEIAETDTFAPPYGKRIADAIRAEIDK